MSTETVASRLGASPLIAKALEDCCINHHIESMLQKAHFLAQMAVESQNFTRTVENMGYSAKRMAEVWPGRYAMPNTAHLAAKLRLPNQKAIDLANAGAKAIANDVYGKRMGNILPNDGWNFRGQGYKMITGRDNVTAYSRWKYGDDRMVKDPTMLQRLPDAIDSGAWFWKANKIGPYADRNDFLAVSQLVNLGHLSGTPIAYNLRVEKTKAAIKFFEDLIS